VVVHLAADMRGDLAEPERSGTPEKTVICHGGYSTARTTLAEFGDRKRLIRRIR
jgi:hypothetical protein